MTSLIALSGLTGCASWRSVPNGDGDGYDVYRPEPYLLIMQGTIAAGDAAATPPKATEDTKKADEKKDEAGITPAEKIADDLIPAGPSVSSSPATAKAATTQAATTRTSTKLPAQAAPAVERKGKSSTAASQPVSEQPLQYTAKIIYLPDFSQRYRLSSSNFLAKSDFTFQIKDGWMLTGITDKSDNTSLADSMLTAITTLATAGAVKPEASKKPADAAGMHTAAFIRLPQLDGRSDPFVLFKIVYNQQGIVTGLVQMVPTNQEDRPYARLDRPYGTGSAMPFDSEMRKHEEKELRKQFK